MKTIHYPHHHAATDRTKADTTIRVRSHPLVCILLAVLITAPCFTAWVGASSYGQDSCKQNVGGQAPHIENGAHIFLPAPIETAPILQSEPDPFMPDIADIIERIDTVDTTAKADEADEVNTSDIPEITLDTVDHTPSDESLPQVQAPLTQESIARLMEPRLLVNARGGTPISYPWPSGAMAVDLYRDGVRVLRGQVADIGGTVYVPVQRYADLFGSFQTTYVQATEEVTITGKNLSIKVRVGDRYITANDRVFYAPTGVISLGGWIFVPIEPMSRALGATVSIRKGYYETYVTSGDPTKLMWAKDFYNETDLYWLSRIISAESRGEPFAGQIAVGNVVLNRVRSSQFPNTVKEVIFDRKYGVQFSPVSAGTIYNTPTESSIRAAKICLEGYSLSTTMIYFYNPSISTSSWIGRTRPYVMTIGQHKFYN